MITFDLLRRYWNRPDLLEHLHKASAILSHGGAMDVVVRHGEAKEPGGSRSRWMRDRFTPDELQTMIDLYAAGTTAREVAEKYNVSLRSIKRLLHQRGVRRRKVT